MLDKTTVLYVDDDQMLLAVMKKHLNKMFDNVLTASSGFEALDLFQKHDIDLLITDLLMPEMNGFQLIEKARDLNRSIVTVVVTSSNDNESFINGIKARVHGYLLKPFNLEEFNKDLSRYLGIIENKKQSKKYKKLLEEYKEAIDESAIVSKTNPDGIITFVNDAFCKASGYSKDELIGKPHSIIRHPDNSTFLYEDIWGTLKRKNTWKGIIKNRRKNGEDYYVKTTISPILDRNDNIIEFIAIRQDITELEHYRQGIEKQLEIASEEIIETQKEVVFTMGAIGETRSKETGQHVKRVAEYSYLLAKLFGLSEKESQLLKQASPMHDIGKVGIEDSILNKPGKLNDDEFEIMKTHSILGYEMLKHSNKDILNAASIVAYEHHEKWDGSGYPRGLKEDEIHIYGRITAIADVFDALGHDRVYKKAWELEKIYELFRREKGKHFDPNLIELFFNNLDKFLKIKELFDEK